MGLPRRFGRYMLLEQLGHGGMGTVYLARPIERDAGIPTPSVLKVLHTDLTNDEMFVRRFKHEAEIATRIDSPHVVKVFDVGRVDDALYFAMEQVIGFNLANMLFDSMKAKRPIPLSFVRVVAQGALAGLQALHAATDANGAPLGFVHRDLSPKNVMVGPNLNVYLIDLGIGKSSAQDWKTQTGIVLGTIGYMSPEQVMGQATDHRSDLYSLGIVVWELLTLTKYIPKGPAAQVLRASVAPKYRAPSSIRPELPPAIDRVLERALLHDRERRFQSAKELEEAVLAALPAQERRAEQRELSGVRDIIEEALAAAGPKTEYREMISQPAPIEEAPPQATEIYATRLARPLAATVLQRSPTPAATAIRPMAEVSAALPHAKPSQAPMFAGAAAIAVLIAGGLFAYRTISTAQQRADEEVRVEAAPLAPSVNAVPRAHEKEEIAPIEERREPANVARPKNTKRAERTEPAIERPPEKTIDKEPEKLSSGSGGMESQVDRLIDRAQALRRRVPESSPKRGGVDAVLAELLQLRASNRLAEEKAAVERAQRQLVTIEAEVGP